MNVHQKLNIPSRDHALNKEIGSHLRRLRINSGATLQEAAQSVTTLIARPVSISLLSRAESGMHQRGIPEDIIAAYNKLYSEARNAESARNTNGLEALSEAIMRGVRERKELELGPVVSDNNDIETSSSQASYLEVAKLLEENFPYGENTTLSLLFCTMNPVALHHDLRARHTFERIFNKLTGLADNNKKDYPPNTSLEATPSYTKEIKGNILQLQRIPTNPAYNDISLSLISNALSWAIRYMSSLSPSKGRHGYRFFVIEQEFPMDFPVEILSAENKNSIRCLSVVPSGMKCVCNSPSLVQADRAFCENIYNMHSAYKEAVLIYPPSCGWEFSPEFRRYMGASYLVQRPFFSVFTRPAHHRRPGTYWWKNEAESLGTNNYEILANHALQENRWCEDVMRALSEKSIRFVQTCSRKVIEKWVQGGGEYQVLTSGQDPSAEKERRSTMILASALERREHLDTVIDLLKKYDGFQIVLTDINAEDTPIEWGVNGNETVGFTAEQSLLSGSHRLENKRLRGVIKNEATARLVTQVLEKNISDAPSLYKRKESVIEFLENLKTQITDVTSASSLPKRSHEQSVDSKIADAKHMPIPLYPVKSRK